MTTTEQGIEPVTLAIEQLAEIVAACAAFQDSVKKYSQGEAREHVYKGFYRPKDQEILSPYAVIFELPGARFDRLADGVALPTGELSLDLGLVMEVSDNPEPDERRFNNWHGSIATAISKYSGPGYRMLTTCTDPPAHSDPRQGENSQLWTVGYTVAWGWK